LRRLSELRQVLKRLQKGLLDHVLGVLPVARDALGNSEEFAIISLHEFLESRHVPVLAGVHEIQVITCRCPSVDFC
jgi:hypothetical protein